MYGVLLDRVEYMLSRVVQKNGRFAGLCPATAAQNAGLDGRRLGGPLFSYAAMGALKMGALDHTMASSSRQMRWAASMMAIRELAWPQRASSPGSAMRAATFLMSSSPVRSFSSITAAPPAF